MWPKEVLANVIIFLSLYYGFYLQIHVDYKYPETDSNSSELLKSYRVCCEYWQHLMLLRDDYFLSCCFWLYVGLCRIVQIVAYISAVVLNRRDASRYWDLETFSWDMKYFLKIQYLLISPWTRPKLLSQISRKSIWIII